MTAKENLLASEEITARTITGYYKTCQRLKAAFDCKRDQSLGTA